MTLLRTTIFGRIKLQPNTFIGGIAKLGGTGVNAPINTAALLATKLGILSSRIKVFRVLGDNIQCNINGSYAIPDYCFGALNLVDANQNITYYYDNTGLVSYIGYFAFRRCSIFYDFLFSSNINYLGNNCFAYTAVVNANLSYLNSTISGEWTNMFNFCTELVTANTGELTNTGATPSSLFRGCPKLESTTTKIKYYTQMYRDSWKINSDVYNEFVLELRGLTFLNAFNRSINFPNCVKIANGEFSKGSGTKYLKEVILPKVVSIGLVTAVDPCFNGQTQLELVDLRACKYFYKQAGANLHFSNSCKIGTIVKVHVFTATSNGGLPDEELTYVKDTRGAIVEFYDDLGNYVSTL